MKKIIAANWKSNKSKNEARNWFDAVLAQNFPDNLEIIIFPPLTLLNFASVYIKEKNLPIKLGAQNVSPFGIGAYTGEVNAGQIKEFADYVLIGHSERRSNFGESDEMINKKIERAQESGLSPIVCVSNIAQIKSLVRNDIIIAYEPIEAIGTGNPEDPKSTGLMAEQIKKIANNSRIIYGGSVNAQNLKNYISLDNIEGVLVGGESLTPFSFSEILKNAY